MTINAFIDKWGQTTEEICSNLGYDEETSDDLLMVDYFFHEDSNQWIPISSSLYSEEEEFTATFLKNN